MLCAEVVLQNIKRKNEKKARTLCERTGECVDGPIQHHPAIALTEMARISTT
jgi:hypothetical protein